MDQAKAAKVRSFKGIISATFTPMKKDGTVKEDGYDEYADHLTKSGVRGVYVNGTTGEGLSLSVAERKLIAKKWVEAGKKCNLDVVIIQIGANCIEDVKELARHAEQIGATGIATLPPNYFKPENNRDLTAYLKAVSEAAPTLPLLYYHIPKFTGVTTSLSSLLCEAKQVVPNLIGAKYTDNDIRELSLCLQPMQDGTAFKIIFGLDEAALSVLPLGVDSFIMASSNLLGLTANKLLAAFDQRDLVTAKTEQNRILRALEVIRAHGSLFPSLKASMNILTHIEVGDPRLPLTPLPQEKQEALRKELEKLGLTRV